MRLYSPCTLSLEWPIHVTQTNKRTNNKKKNKHRKKTQTNTQTNRWTGRQTNKSTNQGMIEYTNKPEESKQKEQKGTTDPAKNENTNKKQTNKLSINHHGYTNDEEDEQNEMASHHTIMT